MKEENNKSEEVVAISYDLIVLASYSILWVNSIKFKGGELYVKW